MENIDSDPWTDAQGGATLRTKISLAAAAAVQHGGVDRDWANTWLGRLGAEPVTGIAEYKINVPILGSYGATIKAASRTDALATFQEALAYALQAGEVRGGAYCQGVFNVALNPAAGGPKFFSGPEDPTPVGDKLPSLDALKSGIREMLKQGVIEQGWGSHYAHAALANMGLAPLPDLVHRTVDVPVAGTARLTVQVFEGADDVDVQAAVSAAMARKDSVFIKPDEVGTVMAPRSDSMGLTLVDEDDEDED